MKALRVLIGCATSCVALDAFLARGHDAWQCDILPADRPTNRHIQDDIRTVLTWGWDLLIVSNPPCTRLCRSGQRWLYGPGKTPPKKLPKGRTHESMIAEFKEGVAVFEACFNAPIPHVAVENPEMNIHAREAMPYLPRPQIVQPWWFGDAVFKATGLYLRNLPELTETNRLTPPARGTDEYRRWAAIHRAPPGPDRWKIRSKTFPGMAAAWADQWGSYAKQKDAAA
ncbi:hypothetical protein [Roseivivax isoporae]|uniref:Uncharacterized protein n=1 Tax=Roseivivax isoporae LMG 25204 TaxID=1449351 RepID=X7F3I2_9RHOB|nr:hypothetical protein [Roseivivax isoporae]ETX26594.1 hypothetical protein RISW2_21880 [Roseivivax isoporae LMG 25204]